MLDWQIGKIIDIQQAGPSTRRFFIELPQTPNFEFEAGQFVTLDLPIHEQKNKRWRSYSIASAPNGTNVFELVIVLLEGGAGTTYLFNETTIGSELTLRGPVGKFTLPETIDKDLYFICTGTGIAPFRSMINYIKNKNIAAKNVYLFFGCRTFGDCLYKDEMLLLQEDMPNFHYFPCFSREEDIPNYGRKGYVHQAYIDAINSNKINGEIASSSFYLCGWKNMIDEAKQTIVDLGYDKKAIHLELYG
jgi:CDP-4-dehydro-6-deoxyglucose reductase